jgi:RNA polymerase sigma factor
MLLSIIHGVFKTKQKTKSVLNEIELVREAKAGNQEVINDLLFAFTPFMKKAASFICKRSIDEHDEEFSVAMNGFHEAVMAFNPDENASLKTFAHLIIKRRLIDYIRKEKTRKDNVVLLYESESTEDHFLMDHQAMEFYSKEKIAAVRREEMERFNELLKDYGLSFTELTKVSPKHADTRKIAFQVAQIIAETPELNDYVKIHKRLPLKEIESLVEVSRKTLERHRKFVMAVVLLVNSDFVYIKEYVKGEFI